MGAGVAEREGFEPSGGVGDNFKRHATLHANARKFSSKWFGSLSPLVPVSRRKSSGVGRGLGSERLREQARIAEDPRLNESVRALLDRSETQLYCCVSDSTVRRTRPTAPRNPRCDVERGFCALRSDAASEAAPRGTSSRVKEPEGGRLRARLPRRKLCYERRRAWGLRCMLGWHRRRLGQGRSRPTNIRPRTVGAKDQVPRRTLPIARNCRQSGEDIS